jgi:hypothetical protein
MSEIQLNDDQCKAILLEGLNREVYENQGKVPDDPAVRLKDATDLVQAARAAYNANNRSENVEAILFIAQCDMKPLPIVNIKDSSNETFPTELKDVPLITLEDDRRYHNGLDLYSLNDTVLDALIENLENGSKSEQVEADIKAYTEEKARRENAAAEKGQEIPQAEAPAEANEKAGEISAEGPPAQLTVDGEATSTSGNAGGSGEVSKISEQEGTDASAFARAQTPETRSEKGRKVKAKSPEKDSERGELETQLTLAICKYHEIDITKIPDLSTWELKYIIDNPDGIKLKEKILMAINEKEVEADAIPSDRGGKSAVGFKEVPSPERIVSKADLNLEEVEGEPVGQISAEREKLESLVTGPILKVYRRGRKEIPSIGDNELRFMILNSDGKVSPENLQRAKNLDEGKTGIISNKPEMVVIKEVPGQEQVSHFIDRKEDVENKMKTMQESKEQFPLTEVTLPSGQKVMVSLPKDIETKVVKDLQNVHDEDLKLDEERNSDDDLKSKLKDDITITEVDKEVVEDNNAEALMSPLVKISKQASEFQNIGATKIEDTQQKNRAMEIIAKEGMPIPPQYSDEEAPILPMDVSVISRDELFSLHAKFHACESRMLWLMCQEEDTLGDIEKLRKNREAVVAAEVPFMGEDGKRNTNEFRDSQVAADEEVLSLGMQEHEIKKVFKRLKVLCDSYHRSCERMSRQMSKYERERLDAPR